MWPTKRLVILWATIAMLSHLFSFGTQVHANEETYFVVTAYYSPLAWQTKYTTWSYAGDIRLNGGWVTTASGGWVFSWLLAWPRNYPFGTKIYFEWFGIWEIADRGWAIVEAWERWHSYDRIDIWMWYGDEWLERALRWGKRTIKWKIVIPSSSVSISFPESALWPLTKLTINPENSTLQDVKSLQEIFTKANLYSWEIDWEYSSIKNELIDFQIKSSIIDSPEHPHAWWYGQKTIAALREKYSGDTSILTTEPVELFHRFNHRVASEKYKIILEYGDLIVDPDSGSADIIQLQKLLTELWEYNWVIDGKYSTIKDNLINLQIRIGLISSENDTWAAGYFWNKTRSALWIYYENATSSVASSNNILSDSEKNRMKTAYNIVVIKLQNEEKRWAKSAKTRLDNLDKQIEMILPSISDTQLKLKLIFLQELI